jgi:hypothetical protein
MRRTATMRSFFRSHWKTIVTIVLLVLLALVTVNPSAAPFSPPLEARLQAHAAALDAPGHPDDAAAYIDGALRMAGYAVQRSADGNALEATLANLAPHAAAERSFVIGARDDAGGTAAVLELARLLKDLRPTPGTEIRFVFFLAAAAGSGSFVAFSGTPSAARHVQDALAAFQGGADVLGHGLAAPAYVQGVTLSGGAAHGRAQGGARTLTVTDTAFTRYPYRHIDAEDDALPDEREPRDYEGMARVVAGLARTITALAAGQRG